MLRAILNAIRAAASLIWRAGLWTLNFALSLPGGVLRGLIGGGAGPTPLPQPEMGAEFGVETTPTQAAKSGRSTDQASVVWRYARAAVTGGPTADLHGLAPEVCGWLQSLDDDAMERVAGASISRVSRHIRGAGFSPACRALEIRSRRRESAGRGRTTLTWAKCFRTKPFQTGGG